MFGVEAVDGLHFATKARTLVDGLNGQLEEFLQCHPDTRLIIVDTLQKVREAGSENYSYSMDYQNITALKLFSDRNNVAILVVHHTRKMEVSDSFDMISGTNGLLGAADGAFILQKKKRTDPTATMQIVGRDQQDQELTLAFHQEHCIWELTRAEKPIIKKTVEPFILKIARSMSRRGEWTGTASELIGLVPDIGMKVNTLTRKLNVNVSSLFNDFGIVYVGNQRTSDRKTFTLLRKQEPEAGDGMTMNDD